MNIFLDIFLFNIFTNKNIKKLKNQMKNNILVSIKQSNFKFNSKVYSFYIIFHYYNENLKILSKSQKNILELIIFALLQI